MPAEPFVRSLTRSILVICLLLGSHVTPYHGAQPGQVPHGSSFCSQWSFLLHVAPLVAS